MKIGGFLPTTLLDYPEKLACTIFTYGCNFRCPFCQNGSLVLGGRSAGSGGPESSALPAADKYAAAALPADQEDYLSSDILERIRKRRNILEGVCVTGGEPTLQKDLPDFLKSIKTMELSVKLDTNGSRPDVVRSLFQDGLIDYVAMDIKSSKKNYAAVSGVSGIDLAAVEESVEFLIHSGIAYEFRTTLVKGLHTYADMEAVALWLKGAEKYYLQSYEDSGLVLCKMASPAAGNPPQAPALESFSAEELQTFLDIARKTVPAAALRGI